MIKIEFDNRAKEILNYERYNNPHPRVQRRMEALWLKSQGLPHEEISRLTAISKTTLWRYLKTYQSGGIESLKELTFYRPESELKAHEESIESYFRRHPPATIKEACAKIEELTGINRSDTQVRKFLKGLGMKFRKIGMIPAKADPKVQETFKKEKLEPVLEEAKEGKRKVYFVDAAHFVLAPFLGFLWSFCRLFIQAPAGRSRFNVLGALDAITHELITVTNDTYINAQSVCDLLFALNRKYPCIPITLILDNARYQKCAMVFALAESLKIDLLYLPSYSPNLNLIERLWKFVKKKCLYSKYYSNFGDFKHAISACLSRTDSEYKSELDSILSLNFQSFSNVRRISSTTS